MFYYVLIVIYSGITLLAGITKVKKDGFDLLSVLFIISSLILFSSIFFTGMGLPLLITGLIMLHISAIGFGLKNKKYSYFTSCC